MSGLLTPFIQNEISCGFLQDGFTILDLLTKDDIDRINTIYGILNKNGIFEQPQFYGVNYSVASLDKGKSNELVDNIIPIIKQRLDNYFTDYEVFGTLFINKPAQTTEAFSYHQDWSYTNEREFAFLTCWVPLVDIEERNGGMSFIKGSHLFFKNYRSNNLDTARFLFEDIPDALKHNVNIKKGQCLCFHQAVFHGSFPNRTNKPRPILVFVIKSKIAPLYHYLKNGTCIDVLEIPPVRFNEFITSIPKGYLPQGVIVKNSIGNDNYQPALQDILVKYLERSKNNKWN